MEHRRRTFSNVIDDDLPDIEKQLPRRRLSSIDDALDDYTDYVYNGTFSVYNFVCCGFLKLICPCCIRKRVPITITK